MNIMVDSWYADSLNYDGFSFHSWLEKKHWYRLLSPVISRVGLIRGILLYLCARQSSGTVVVCDTPGFWTFLMLRAMAGSSGGCFVLEFIRRRPLRFINRLIYPLWFSIVAAPSFRKAATKAQVMTNWEREHYANMFRVGTDRFVHIPFSMINSDPSCRPANKSSWDYIMSSGRVSCDWSTLIRAVAGLQQYPVIIVHSKKDLRKFRRMKLPVNVKLICNIPQDDHNRLLEKAVCYVIVLFDTVGSTGQARLSHAINLRVPVIVTRVPGIEEYVRDCETAIIVPQGDPVALRKAIHRLMIDPQLREYLSDNAIRYYQEWTREKYLDCLSDNVKKALYRVSYL